MHTTKKNAPCPCGSGLKYKKCCLVKDVEKEISVRRRRRMLKIGSFVIFLIVGSVTVFAYNALRPGPYDSLAKCLTAKGYKVYGAHWCPNCKKQKAIFGKSFEYIDYTECSPNGTRKVSDYCKSRGIKKIPTWVTPDGRIITGTKTSAELSDISACDVSGSSQEVSATVF